MAHGARHVDWADLRDPRSATFACDGRLYHLNDPSTVDPADYRAQARLSADFAANEFRPVRPPPSAMTW